jgi:lysophospholipase L1-like esterase
MKPRFISLAILALFWGVAPAAAADGPPYYLALGDSLALGVQPNAAGTPVPTNNGYVNDLYAFYRAFIPNLRLANLGCSGELTTTMRKGGKCTYTDGNSQLDEAVAFLHAHRVAFVTIDIGANDIDGCVTAAGLSQSCVDAGIKAAMDDLPKILYRLRSEAPDVPIFAMNYYDPFLALATFGALGQQIAVQSLQNAIVFNAVLENAYGAFGVPVADVARAFRTTDTTPFLGIPVNVLLAVAWTWMAAPPPIGPDFHPNVTGYAVIAASFAKVIRLH